MQAAAPDSRRPDDEIADERTGLDGPMPFANFAIDRSAEVPIGVQLAWALRARIDDGSLAPGARLPLIDALEGEGGAVAEQVADEQEAAPSAKRDRPPDAVRRVGKRPPQPATAGT
jgi:hypothetical protein